jgi:hypothetical protein
MLDQKMRTWCLVQQVEQAQLHSQLEGTSLQSEARWVKLIPAVYTDVDEMLDARTSSIAAQSAHVLHTAFACLYDRLIDKRFSSEPGASYDPSMLALQSK